MSCGSFTTLEVAVVQALGINAQPYGIYSLGSFASKDHIWGGKVNRFKLSCGRQILRLGNPS